MGYGQGSRHRLDLAELGVVRAIRVRGGGGPSIAGARLVSAFGEHGLGWVALGVAASIVDRRRGRRWLAVAGAAVAAHAAGIAVKHAIRRPRPSLADLPVLATAPSDLSFPSSHACSTTAASVVMAPMIGAPVAAGIVATMAVSRVVLGMHYPSDVLAGMLLGAAVGRFARRRLTRARP